ncbi:MAG: hypothetical protein KDB02_15080 [Acidimicrobiales bacterium]|nr:hypothetical protein [Acidimicrobiales bacterium]
MLDPLAAELAYREAIGVISRTYAIRRAIALPLRLLAAVYLVGAAVVLVVGQFHLLAYFGPALGGVVGTSFWWYRRYARTCGLWFPVWPWVVIIVVSTFLGATVSHDGMTTGRQWVSDFGPPLVLAAAVGVVAAWLRSWRLAATATAMAVATALAATVAQGNAAVALQLLAYSALMLWGSAEPEPTEQEGRR